MKKILKNLTLHKHVIIWTIFYTAIMWTVLYFMFNFNLFNATQWHKLARAELHGFAGFVFGLLILAALPLYIATTTLIIRNKKPLITIPKPNIKLPSLTKQEPTPPTATDTTTPSEPTEKNPELPVDLPPELHSVFIRARNRISAYEQRPLPTDSTTPDTSTPEPTNTTLPLPTDFDIQLNDIPGMNEAQNFTAPIFTDINFDDTEDELYNTDTQTTTDNQTIIKHLTATNATFSQIDDIIITNKHAIITHNDSDFWVIDDENWFANGKTRPSPANKIKDFAIEHNLTPVIYLESTNIMDLDTHIKSWESDGIIVITKPEEL